MLALTLTMQYEFLGILFKISLLACCRIIDGFEALDDLEKMPVNPKNYKPLSEARITSVTIHANPLAG